MALELITGYAGAPHISSADEGKLNGNAFSKETLFFKENGGFECSYTSNTTISITSGCIMTSGRFIAHDGPTTLSFQAGTAGKNRNDLVCLKYETQSSGVETVSFEIVQGTPTDGTPEDPEVSEGSIYEGSSVAYIKLWRLMIRGLSVSENPVDLALRVDPIFDWMKTINSWKSFIDGTKLPGIVDTINAVKSSVDAKIDGKANVGHTHDAGSIVSGVLPVAHGGTGATSAAGILSATGITQSAATINGLPGQVSTNKTDIANLKYATTTETNSNSLISKIKSNDNDITSINSKLGSVKSGTTVQAQIDSLTSRTSTVESKASSLQSQVSGNDTDIAALRRDFTPTIYSGAINQGATVNLTEPIKNFLLFLVVYRDNDGVFNSIILPNTVRSFRTTTQLLSSSRQLYIWKTCQWTVSDDGRSISPVRSPETAAEAYSSRNNENSWNAAAQFGIAQVIGLYRKW